MDTNKDVGFYTEDWVRRREQQKAYYRNANVVPCEYDYIIQPLVFGTSGVHHENGLDPGIQPHLL